MYMSSLEIKVMDLEKNMLKFLVKVFRSLYLLKFEPDLIDTLPDIRYYSKMLCCTIPNALLTSPMDVTSSYLALC